MIRPYGNCLEYARNTQSKAIEAGLPQTFVIQANPDHIFNAAIVEDKMLDSRFDLKVQEIMFKRLSQKISKLDPNDFYF